MVSGEADGRMAGGHLLINEERACARRKKLLMICEEQSAT
jgi:hypothetical protein